MGKNMMVFKVLCYTIDMKLQHDKEQFTQQLCDWYDQHARILPWRQEPSAYRVWVSEIMLQQTRVEAVKPYFDRFITALPTLQHLAEAEDDQLAKLWEGLGYYHRVRNMKKCAQACVHSFDGKLPSTYDELITLPGIGSYTAGAIASIAFQECVPAVDGNVLRVFSRVWIREDDILKEATKKAFQKIISDYIPAQRSGDFNQALMELGAMVCVPNTAPRCNVCPVASQCMGYQSGDAHRLPNKTAKKKRRMEKRTIVLLVCNDRVFLQKREATGLLAGLYEFLNLEGHFTKKDLKSHLYELGIDIHNIVSLHPSKHIFSHVEWHMKGYLIQVNHMDEGLWCTQTMLDEQYAIPTALKAYRDALQEWWKHES